MVTNTYLSTAEILNQLQKNVGENVLFSSFRSELLEAVGIMPSNSEGWENIKLDEREAAELLQSAIGTLEEMAIRFAHTTDDQIYDDATAIAQSLQGLLAEAYGFQRCKIQIMPPSRGMEAVGLVSVETDENGELVVKPKAQS